MALDDLTAFLAALDDVLVLRPQPGDGTPEISWGDLFFYVAPDGTVPATQPFATVVTKDYPDEPASGLDAPGAYRLNVDAPAAEFVRLLGAGPAEALAAGHDPRARDTWFPHPVYGRAGWVSVVEPERQLEAARTLLLAAYGAARTRSQRRRSGRSGD